MLVKNLTSKHPQLVNGLTGHVISFVELNPADYEHGVANELVPVVEFSLANGQKFQYTATREKWDVEKPGGDSASRTQVPLTLAWAMSMHKAQGQSLDRVKIDLEHTFARGVCGSLPRDFA
ncbi:hypothetical protein B0H19DRAFT_381362 [Mycena capillaripes]|nr:hypothetical protein B0H19DRAFT_381362 [Mycena capillaripes]